MEYTIKLDGIRLTNIKNVNNGYINVRNAAGSCDIIGIYGQNGTGKTAVIDCVEMLQILMMGQPLDRHFFDLLYVNTRESAVSAAFSINKDGLRYEAEYEVRLKFTPCLSDFFIVGETLKLAFLEGREKHKTVFVCDFEDLDEVFTPHRQFGAATGSDKKLKRVFDTRKILAREKRKSFFFDDIVIEKLAVKGRTGLSAAIGVLRAYASMDLFVIKNSHSGIISLSELIPLSFKIGEGSTRIVKGEAEIRLDQPTLFPMVGYKDVVALIGQLNVVLKTIVPDLKIEVKEYGEQAGDFGEPCMRFELLAHSGNTLLPLRNESEGIKKIISILSALISFYNRENTTVLVDELDAGIFEYLLGELLVVLKENGRGQLIFTSHNLRPIEVLDKECIYFTTVNPTNRYVRLTNAKSGENLRDFYYRAIQLGGQKEKLYDETNLSELSLAFRIAGKDE